MDWTQLDDDPDRAPAEGERDYIGEVFGADGLLSKRFTGYEPRVGQIELAMAVEDGMRDGFNVVAEAPTGTGKSLGYGVPATWYASHGQRVVVVTANIALQEQLVTKDLPLIEKVVPWKFTYALAKGLNNYLCKAMFDESVNKIIMQGPIAASDLKQWSEVVRWAARTSLGDVSELPFEPSQGVRQRYTIMSEECTGKKCSHYSECFAMRARTRVRNAGVVVTNYSLFFADLVLKMGGAEGVLPRYTHVVFDEGHSAAEHARGFLGFRISRGGVAYAVKLLDHRQSAQASKGPMPVLDSELKHHVTQAADEFFAAVTSLFHSKAYKVRFERAWDPALRAKASELCGFLAKSASVLEGAAAMPGITTERALELHNVAAKCAETAKYITLVSDFASNDWVFYLEEEGEQVMLKGKPIDVSGYLYKQLFQPKNPHKVKSVTVTSATLATEVDDYSYVCEQLGVKDAEKMTVLSPFDVANNTLLVCPPMASPQSDRYLSDVAERMLAAIEQARGRTLCLFTSHRVLNATYTALRGRVPYTVLKQGTLPRMQLIAKFKADVSSVLLGTESFWAGVDVPGEALSQVVIDRLPFPNISDPLQDVLRARLGSRYFSEHSVPAAVIAFRQGCGRLLRTTTDRGVIVILDSRITEKGYGRSFTRSFPKGTRITRNLAEIGPFLDKPATVGS